jgi:signal transduction histidine kinase
MKRLAELLRHERERIIAAWEQAVLADPAVPEANRLPHPLLRDHIPHLLDAIVAELEAANPLDDEPSRGRELGRQALPQQHAAERFGRGYSLRAAVRELSHLRAEIAGVCCEHQDLDPRGIRLLHAALDECMSVAAVEMERLRIVDAQREHRRLQELLQLLPVGVFLCDESGAAQGSNRAFDRIWGDPQPHVSTTADFGRFIGFDPESGRRLAADEWGLAIALRTGTTVRDQEVDIIGFDGQKRTILTSATPLRGADGALAGGVAVVVDVTDRVRTERRLQEEAQLRERFIAFLGHDLRNPLATVVAAASLHLTSDLPDGHASLVRKIARAGERMDRMIEELLELSRVRAGAFRLRPAASDLCATVEEVVDELRLAHPDRTVVLTSHGDAHGEWDSDRMTRVFTNLIGNALKYGSTDGPVRVELSAAEDRVVVTVSNPGPPIPPGELTQIFDPFRRGTGSAARPEGLGLGLFISSEVVRAQGGSIAVRSSAEEGTTFTVILPRHPPPENVEPTG